MLEEDSVAKKVVLDEDTVPRLDVSALARTFGVTTEMARFRYYSTGVAKQVARMNRFGCADAGQLGGATTPDGSASRNG